MLTERLYGWLLRAYPPAFRRLYEADMRAAFADLAERTRRDEGAFGLVRLSARTLLDTARSGLAERLSRRGYRVGRSRLRIPRPGLASHVEDAGRDLRRALRTLARSPGFSLVVVATLALGIGANTAIFSVVNAVLIRPLPFGDDGRIVHLSHALPHQVDGEDPGFSVREIEDYRRLTPSLTNVAEYHRMVFVLTGHGEPDRVRVGVVSHDFFDLLEVRPAQGREFVAAEDRAGAKPVVVLSDGYWRRRFAADPAVVGRTVVMNGLDHTIIGVLPPFPQFPQENDVYMPVSVCPTRSHPDFIATRDRRMMDVFGRLRPESTLVQAERDVAAAAARLAHDHPEVYGAADAYAADVEMVHEELVAEVRPVLVLLLTVAGFVLLVACANAANLALARANRRSAEISVHAALGAGRARLARQLLTEHVLLALAGGGLGLVLAAGATDLLVAYAARFTTRAAEVSVDRSVLAFTLVASLLTGLLFGSAPVLGRRREPLPGLVEGAHRGGPGRRRVEGTLVVGQVAVAFVVLTGAALSLRSVWALSRVEVGVDTDEVVAFNVTLADGRYDHRDTVSAFFAEVQGRLAEVPGVVASARSMDVPLLDDHGHAVSFHPEGHEAPASAESRTVDPGYFEVVGMELLDGRMFTEADHQGAPFVAVVNRTLADEVFGGESPVGQRVVQCWAEGCNGAMTIVGVVSDVRYHGPSAVPVPEVYRSTRQIDWGGAWVLVRTSLPPGEVEPVLAQVVHSVDGDVAVSDVRTLRLALGDLLAPRRLTATLLVLFGLVALALTLAGIFGLLSMTAAARTREIGIRKALGAPVGEVRGMVVWEGLRLVLAGLGLGAVLALLLTRYLRQMPWGVEAVDPFTWLATTVLFLGVSALACWVPARRASEADAVATLKAT